ncbi:hypothetical protein MLD38_002479 [Melastoma candidum]|uniref:Uncharacterized protein n=1 Tax=Melastoma candidum TaxID=119954 RepID=A0ACB9S2I9_9MYRT|nr:hypothetical protein MLD38_002479 [Melastoma candidum]
MATCIQKHVTGVPVIPLAAETENSMRWAVADQNSGYWQLDHFVCQLANTPTRFNPGKASRSGFLTRRMSRLARKEDGLASFQEHMRLRCKFTEAVMGKLSLGARILRVGGMEKVFKHLFDVSVKERLIKASQCYLSTTAGPLAGLLFISTEKVAFCSDKSIKLFGPTGDSIRIKYKVVIPLSKIESANQSENMKRPRQKYIQIVTVDNFDFWLMGFISHQKSFKCLQQAISQQQTVDKATKCK